MQVYDDFSIARESPSADRPRVWGQPPQFWCCPSPQSAGRTMRRSQQVLLWLSISILGALTLSPVSVGQASPGSEAAAPAIDDWTYHHVIFSKPATAEQARGLEQDPRYWQQIRRQSPSAPETDTQSVLAPELQVHSHGSSNNAGLWQENLGTGATMGALNYPAKYSLTTTTASCTSDFVVYPTGLAGAAGPGGQA